MKHSMKWITKHLAMFGTLYNLLWMKFWNVGDGNDYDVSYVNKKKMQSEGKVEGTYVGNEWNTR